MGDRRSIEAVSAFRARVQEASAERRVDTAHGVALFKDSAPIVYDANFLRVEQDASADELVEECDAVMEPFFHRRVVMDARGAALAERFAELGWARSSHQVLIHERAPDRLVDASTVTEVPLEALEAAHTRGTLGESFGTAELAAQLFAMKRRVAAAVPTRFLAIHEQGEVVAYCELYSDGEVAQIEDVNVVASHRGQGLGRTIVQGALAAARASAPVVFLEALAQDWPRHLYSKLGFEHVDDRHLYLRPPHPLSRLALRTPRLELRLPTVAEVRALGERARRDGVHGPELMPFEFAWTDRFEEPGYIESFLEFHQNQLDTWSPADWHLGLVAFLDGEPVGNQGLNARDFRRERSVTTGSWLSLPLHGRGLGTEMRAAVLTLAFAGLGARHAWSGAHTQNAKSLGVSAKFAYEPMGTKLAHPRGEPVEHLQFRLERSTFRSPVPVEIDGLEPLLPLFGAGR